MSTRILPSCSRIMLSLGLASLAGCVSVPMAPLVYGSKTVGGLDISTATTSANPEVSLSIGYKRDDVALVPVAVMKNKDQTADGDKKNGEYILIIRGDDVSGEPATTAGGLPPKNHDDGKSRRDAMSVFGSFEGRGWGSADKVNAQAFATNYFSTGVAAQHLAEGVGRAVSADQLRRCFVAVQDLASGIADSERPTYLKKGLEACSEAGKVPAKPTPPPNQ